MSTVRYHFNPETGKTGICSAKVRGCRFNLSDSNHYSSEGEARLAYENFMKDENNDSITFKKENEIGKFSNTVNSSKELIERALSKPLLKNFNEEIPWLSELKKECQEAGAKDFQILDEFSVGGGEVLIVWSDKSPRKADISASKKGFYTTNTSIFEKKTGFEVARLKLTGISEESFKKVFGNDEYTPFRFMEIYEGKFMGVIGYTDDGKKDNTVNLTEEEKKAFNRKLWLKFFQSWGATPKSWKQNPKLIKSHYSMTDEDIPDDETIVSDLEFASIEIKKRIRKEKEYHGVPYVAYSEVEYDFRNKGLGSALYLYTGRKLADENKFFRSSSLQSDSAKRVWRRFKEDNDNSIPVIDKSIEYGGTSEDVSILDFRKHK